MEDKLEQMMKQMKPIYSELFGTDSGNAFDDFKDSEVSKGSTQQLGRITGIEVRSGYILDAIGVLREGEKESRLHGNKRGGSSYKILFEEGDSLKSLEGVHGVPFSAKGTISNLVIKTSKGKTYGSFGNGINTNKFCIELPDEGEFIGFYGNVNAEVSVIKLGVIYRKSRTDTNALSDYLQENLGGENEKEGSTLENLFGNF